MLTIKDLGIVLCSLFTILVGFLLLKNKPPQKPKNNFDEMLLKNIDDLNGFEFEYLLSVLFKKLKYKTIDLQNSKDYGADLLISKNGISIVVQAKRYKNKVGLNSVQQIVAARAKYKADRCIVVTNNFFTKPAKELARVNDVVLIDKVRLQYLIDVALSENNDFNLLDFELL